MATRKNRPSKIADRYTPSLVVIVLLLAAVAVAVPRVIAPRLLADDARLAEQIGVRPPYFPTDRPPGPLQRGLVTTEEGNRIVMAMRRAVRDRPDEKATANLLLHYAFDRRFGKSDWIRDEAFRLFPDVTWGKQSAAVAGKIERALAVEKEPWVQRSQIIALSALGASARNALPLLGRLQKSGKISEVRNESTRAVELIRADLQRVKLAGVAKTSKNEERATREKEADAANRAAAKKAREAAGEE